MRSRRPTALKTNTDEFSARRQKIGNVHKEAASDPASVTRVDSLVAPIRDTSRRSASLNEVERQRISDSAGIRTTLEAVQVANQRLEHEAHSS